jgi:hypothetical protein
MHRDLCIEQRPAASKPWFEPSVVDQNELELIPL